MKKQKIKETFRGLKSASIFTLICCASVSWETAPCTRPIHRPIHRDAYSIKSVNANKSNSIRNNRNRRTSHNYPLANSDRII